MSARHDGRLRIALASSALLGVAALTTAAFTDDADVTVHLDGSLNRFDIVVAGSADPGWTPTPASWVQGNPDAHRIRLSWDDAGATLGPGGTLNLRVAAQNASPRLAGSLSLTIRDPEPHGDLIDPVTGRFTDLWSQLVFTVSDGDTVILDHVKATDLTEYTWPATLAPGEFEVLDVAIHLPDSVDNRWQTATTDVQFHFEAVNA